VDGIGVRLVLLPVSGRDLRGDLGLIERGAVVPRDGGPSSSGAGVMA